MRIATWNLSNADRARAARLGTLLSQLGGADIVMLQEAAEGGMGQFVEAAGLDWHVHIGERFPEMLEAIGRANGPRCVALAGRGEPPRNVVPFPDINLPEKMLAAWIQVNGRPVTIVSYHAPTGAQHGIGKVEQALRAARWLARLDGTPVLMGGDFNTPLVDPPDDDAVRTHWHTGDQRMGNHTGDDVLVGPDPWHGLRDAYRLWLGEHPDERKSIRRERPDGPLRTTHVLRGGKEMRYDQIWVSNHFSVADVDHFYEEAREAGTDHALVVADVTSRAEASADPT